MSEKITEKKIQEDPLLKIENLHAQYNTDEGVVYALNGFNLSLKRGQTLGLVGETGAGKTTMALSILKLLPANVGEVSQGKITYDGLDILSADKQTMRKLRGDKISMIFQDPMTSLNPVLSVGSQIYEVLELHYPHMSKEDKIKRVDEMMELVGIPAERKIEYPHQFSGGMKQRIVIAMALVAEPELLLADEPTTALDVTIQAQILELIRQLKIKFNSSMILITHDLGVVAEVCDVVSVAYGGRVVEHGSIEDVYARTENHPYTKGLFESIPDLTSDADRLIPIPGFMSDPRIKQTGCAFALRCSHCMEICKEKEPEAYTNGSHTILCHLYARRDTSE